MNVISSEKIPIKNWAGEIETGALDQAKNLANLPFAFKHIALMPDCHTGYGMPIGGVLATNNVIVPNAVGVDIGCGISFVETTLTNINVDQIKKIMGGIRSKIPVGFSHHLKKQKWDGFDNLPKTIIDGQEVTIPIIAQEVESAKKQIGTLGGGNHFIEIQKSDTGHICFMVHSGSRNIGYKIAKEYNNIAQNLCKKWYSNIPKIKGKDGLAFLPIVSNEGIEYILAMNFAINFAIRSRAVMIEKIKESFCDVVECTFSRELDIAHNYARYENHFGKNVYVHRKGATHAGLGRIGIIPGSQGTSSYIVRGLGNKDSFYSCSHGAGRIMSRKKAQNELCLNDEIKSLDDKGIIHGIRNKNDLDEAPSAYKNIDEVMKKQKDLVEIVEKLNPLAVIKA